MQSRRLAAPAPFSTELMWELAPCVPFPAPAEASWQLGAGQKSSLPFVLLLNLTGISSSGFSGFYSNQIIVQNSRTQTK